MSVASSNLRDEAASSAAKKCMIRLVCFVSLLFFMAWIDRVNIGFAALQMNTELNLSATAYGLGAGLFFIAYAIFEVPSNLIMMRVGPRVWIARIMITWGIVSTCFAFIHEEKMFYVLRFLLGMAEAGFVPGIVVYLSNWFPKAFRARAFSLFFSCALLSPIIGGPISGWILTSTNGVAGYSGWRFMFLLEGIPAIILGIVTFFYLTDKPENASWLSVEEKESIRRSLVEERESETVVAHASFGMLLRDARVWLLTATYFFWAISGYGIIYWLPTIIKSMSDLTPVQIAVLNALPFVFGIAGLVIVSKISDRTGRRRQYLISMALLGGVALAASAFTPSLYLAVFLICVSAFGIWGQQAVFWTLPAAYLKERSAAAGVAFINMAAGVGGFCGPYLVGVARDATNSYALALVVLASTSFIVAILVTFIRVDEKAHSRKPLMQALQK